jgi:DNA-binding MarR family transcriptional regulator
MCLHVQRAARAVARRYDDAFRPLDLTNGQFSLLMSLNREKAPGIAQLSELLGMDRTTLTAALKSLARRRLVNVAVDPADRRGRLLTLTANGRRLLASAMPLWRRTQVETERLLSRAPSTIRGELIALSSGPRDDGR